MSKQLTYSQIRTKRSCLRIRVLSKLHLLTYPTDNGRQKNSILTSPEPAPIHRMQLLAKLIEVYVPESAQDPTTAGQAHACWVRALLDITPANSVYNISLAALCAVQLGIWNRDPVLVRESSQLYGSALGELRKTIGCRKPVALEATLASTVILSTYEVSHILARI